MLFIDESTVLFIDELTVLFIDKSTVLFIDELTILLFTGVTCGANDDHRWWVAGPGGWSITWY